MSERPRIALDRGRTRRCLVYKRLCRLARSCRRARQLRGQRSLLARRLSGGGPRRFGGGGRRPDRTTDATGRSTRVSLAVEAELESLLRRLADFGLAEELRPWIESALGKLEAGRFSTLVTVAVGEETPRTPVVLWRNGGRSYLYFQKYLLAERDLYRLLRCRLAAPVAPKPVELLREAVSDVLMRSPLTVAGKPIASDFDQRTAALWTPRLLRDFVIISGRARHGQDVDRAGTVLRALVRAGT